MTETELILDQHEIKLHTSFTYFPVRQQAEILAAIAGVHRAVMSTAFEKSLSFVPLGIDEVRTGNSIDWKFGDRLPRFLITPEHDLQIWIPTWAVGLVVSSALITAAAGAVKGVDDILDVINERAPEMTQLAREKFDLPRLAHPVDVAGSDIQRQVTRFHREIDLPNITLVEVNGVTLRRRDEEEGGRQPVVTS
jgi:hypothetical protein